MNVEFIDRYGGNVPSSLRICADCEGMGWGAGEYVEAVDDHRLVTCATCAGSGRTTWLRTLARVPRWLWKGIAFIRWGMNPMVNPPEWSRWKRFRTLVWCCYGADLQRLWS